MAHQITLVGFGNQGGAWGENLRDSGWEVSLALRPKSPSWERATSLQFEPKKPEELIPKSSIVALLIPDDAIASFMIDHLSLFRPKQTIVLAHGYAYHFKTAHWPDHV